MSYFTSTGVDSVIDPVAPRRDWVESVMPAVLIGGGLLSIGWSALLVWSVVELFVL